MFHISQIDIHKVNELLEEESAEVVDIRDPASFAMGHIPTARHLNEENIDELISQMDNERTVVVCCYHGISSQGVAAYLMSKGFKDVHSLIGGYKAWQQHYPSE